VSVRNKVLLFILLLWGGVPSGALQPEQGIASWYGPGFHGRKTANGEIYNMYEMTAAHKTLPFGTRVKVIDLETGRSVIVRINDRGPFVEGRVIDLSYAAARALGMEKKGTARVALQILPGDQDRGKSLQGIYIQAGSFTEKANAIRQMNKVWKITGYKPRLFVSENRYRLILGPWKERQEAVDILTRMKRKGLDGIIYHGTPDR